VNVVFTIAGLTPGSGGPSRTVPALCSALADQRLNVELVTLDYGKRFGSPLTPPEPVRTSFVPCHRPLTQTMKWSPLFSSVLRKRCHEMPAHVLHDTGLWLPTNHAAATIARELNLAFIISPRGMLASWAINYKGWKKRIAWFLYQKRDLEAAQVLHATSREEVRGFRNSGLLQPVALVPNGVDCPDWQEPPSRQGQTRTVLFLSRIHPVKGLLNLVQAWALVRPKGWRVVVAGEDENGHQRDVENAIHQHQLEKDFDFQGPADGARKWDLYRSADVFVLPSHTENFGLVVAEALACGLPVITTKGTSWEQLVTSRSGWWVQIGAESLAAALSEATSLTDDERREMGRRGRKLVETQYAWHLIAARMCAVYQWMLGKGPKPDCVVEA